MSDEQSVNIPQLVAFLLISALAVRYFFFSSANNSAPGSSSERTPNRNAGGRRVDERHVEQILAMFPQYGRREIIWDLMRNGGSVQATTERILGGRRLEVPPPSFQPPPPPTPLPQASTNAAIPRAGSSVPATARSTHPDLIARYNLSSKISSSDESAASQTATTTDEDGMSRRGGGRASGWSQNKSERQAALQRRREEMILAARRKLLDKEAAQAKTHGS